MNKIREKLDELSKLVSRNPSESWNEELNQLETAISKMEKYEDFLNHAVSRVVILKLIAWTRDCDMLLLGEESVKENERMRIVSRRQTLLDILGIFSPRNVKGKTIDQYIDNTIKEFTEFYK